jgi:hypothetical protein
LRFIQKDTPETVLEAISGTLKPVTLANEELKYAIKNEFQLDLFKDYSFIIANNSIWGMTKKIDNKSFLINPDKILNVLFDQYLEEYLFDEINSELKLKQIIEIYVEKETVLSIPKHYYFTSQELEENKFYDENIKIVLLEEYI